MIKKIILRITISLFIVFGFLAWNLYLMDIEDHYGDLEAIFYDSKSGDIILNKQTQKFGVITKNWNRANVITRDNGTIDLSELIYIDQKENKYEILRSKNNLEIQNLSFEKIGNLEKRNLLEIILKN